VQENHNGAGIQHLITHSSVTNTLPDVLQLFLPRKRRTKPKSAALSPKALATITPQHSGAEVQHGGFT
jgi:hypothetical protein